MAAAVERIRLRVIVATPDRNHIIVIDQGHGLTAATHTRSRPLF